MGSCCSNGSRGGSGDRNGGYVDTNRGAGGNKDNHNHANNGDDNNDDNATDGTNAGNDAHSTCSRKSSSVSVTSTRSAKGVVHGSGGAIPRIEASDIDELVVTDTIPLAAEGEFSTKIRQLSCAQLLAETMTRISNEESVSSLFTE